MTPEILERVEFIIVGIRSVLRLGESEEIGLWTERLLPRTAEIAPGKQEFYCVFGQIPGDLDGKFEYVAGVKTDSLENIPTGMAGWIVPSGNYAVAEARSLANIGPICREIITDWLPDSGYRRVKGPMFARAAGDGADPTKAKWTVNVPIETPEVLAQLDTWFA